jgi:hypothetical protein
VIAFCTDPVSLCMRLCAGPSSLESLDTVRRVTPSGEHVIQANVDDVTCQGAGERVRAMLPADSGGVAERCFARIHMIQNLAAATHRRHVVLP